MILSYIKCTFYYKVDCKITDAEYEDGDLTSYNSLDVRSTFPKTEVKNVTS